jgi:voltage-gated sodium channel
MAAVSNNGLSGGSAPIRSLIESQLWERIITGLIVLNAVTLGLETSATVMARFGPALILLDRIILGIFVAEIATRMAVYGWRFWRDPWSVFDFLIVAISLVPATGSFTVLRALRVLRVLRLISTVKSIRRVVTGLLSAIPSMGAVIVLLLLIFYVFSVMSTKLFGASFPDLFGSIGTSAFSLFQVMTLEGWAAEIVRPIMEKYPWAWAFFIIFILITSFAVLNLFIGIIVDSMQREHESDMAEDRARSEATIETILVELRALRSQVETLQGDQAGGLHPQPRRESPHAPADSG